MFVYRSAVGLDTTAGPFAASDLQAPFARRRGHPIIMLNENDGMNRKRFTCAHEIGHFVRRGDTTEPYTTIDFRDRLSSLGSDPEEIYANEFAACCC